MNDRKNAENYQKIRAALELWREEICRHLISLASVPSVRGEALPGAPFGKGCRDALLATEKLYRSFGYPTTLRDEGGYLMARAGNPSGEKTIGVFAHADVVPVGDGWLFTAPFEPIVKDGFVIGRGVYDNKAGILMGLYAARAIETLRLPMRSGLLLCTGSNEESGMADMRAFAANEAMPDVSLVPDNGFPVCRGERGILRFWAVSGEKMSGRILAVEGGNAFNAVLGAASVTLGYSDALCAFLSAEVEKEPLLTLQKEGGANGGRLILRSHGTTGHAAAPGDAVHGMRLISEVLARCAELPASDRAIFAAAAGLTRDCYGAGLGIASVDPDFGRLTCVNGIAASEDGHLALSFDSRYGMAWEPPVLEKTVTDTLRAQNWAFRLHENSRGYLIPADAPLVTALTGAYRACTGEANASPYLSAGGTYARELKNAFSMCDVHAGPSFEVPAGHGGAHQPDEMVSLDGILESTAILATMILACDGLLN